MTTAELRHKETRLTETLYSALDARDTVLGTGSSMLLYLADMFVTRIQEELQEVRRALQDGNRRSPASG